jgi:hypothetical protein
VETKKSIQWRYSQNRALASAIFRLHNFLSLAATQKSGSILLHHIFQLFLGFPTDFSHPNLALSTFLGIRVSSIFWTCPAH